MIIFLDYDGVLHADAVYLAARRPVLRAEGTLFMWAPILVEVLAPHPQIKIVISSSWARIRGFSRARDALPEELRTRVIGSTWHSSFGRSPISGMRLPSNWWDEASRYRQIHRYVTRAKLRDNDWVAIDDHAEEWPEKHRWNLIWTDSARGLSNPDIVDQLRARLATASGADVTMVQPTPTDKNLCEHDWALDGQTLTAVRWTCNKCYKTMLR